MLAQVVLIDDSVWVFEDLCATGVVSVKAWIWGPRILVVVNRNITGASR